MNTSPLHFLDLNTPAILIDQTIMRNNLHRMQQLADSHQISLRPHIKTHKSVVLAQEQLQAGAIGIAVAKLGEAEVMARHGIRDIQIANQIIGRAKIERLVVLAENCRVSCAVDSCENVRQLGDRFATHDRALPVLIEIDCGLHRSGVESQSDILALAESIARQPGVRLEGIMTHAGQAYAAPDQQSIERVAAAQGQLMASAAATLAKAGHPVPVVSVGSTPTAIYDCRLPGVTELRVGNYLFNDAIQVALGVATTEQCALSVLVTVISVHQDRVVVDAGSKTFSSDAGAHGNQLVSGYGQIVGTQLTVSRLSEEHGVIQVNNSPDWRVGDKLRVLPNHACPVMNLAEHAWLVESDRVIHRIIVDARARTE